MLKKKKDILTSSESEKKLFDLLRRIPIEDMRVIIGKRNWSSTVEYIQLLHDNGWTIRTYDEELAKIPLK
jgi:hypothetical protein